MEKWMLIIFLAISVSGLEISDITPYSAEIITDQTGELNYYRNNQLIHTINITGNTTLTGLSGNTDYKAVIGSEEVIFTTPSTDIMIGPNFEMTIDGEPFFPIMQWLQAAHRIEYQSGLGINVFVGQGNNEAPADYLDECQANDVYGIVHFDEQVIDHDALFGWLWVDEPDLSDNGEARRYPDEVLAQYKHIKSIDPNHPMLLTLTASFFSRFPARDWMEGSKHWYYDYMQTADILGFDYYMVYGWCKPEWIAEIADSQDEFLAYGNKTTFQWIEAARTTSKYCDIASREPDDGPYPEEIRNEVWQAIVHGAKAIGYFTHSWECPSYTQWCLSSEQEEELRRTNRQITELAPAILSQDLSFHSDNVDYMVSRYNGTTYIFAVNKKRETATQEFDINGYAVAVYDEDRIININAGFSDEFESLGVHIYIIHEECIELGNDEMLLKVNEWKLGIIDMPLMMESVTRWKHGC